MALIINQSVWDQAKYFLDNGAVGQAWQVLANAGDSYAVQAAAIFNQPDSIYAGLVEVQWSLHATPEQFADKYDLVAEQHLTQYLELIKQSGEFRLPNTKQIEKSYHEALAFHNVPQLCAVDAMFSLLDYQDTFGDISWAAILAR